LATLQYYPSNGSYIVTVPKDIVKTLKAKKGDSLHFNVTESGQVQVIKIKDKE
jgi:bifunctional DNA-binding transcriptional regulator/antitoxin component of YhaV-PrlF toxin-antitoxin module